MSKKTRKQWEKSGIDLDKFMKEPCEIDEDLFNYLGEVVSPKYCGAGLVQLGEAERHLDDENGFPSIGMHMTASEVNGKYYLGIIPEFKQ